jgi:alkaline phosphatase
MTFAGYPARGNPILGTVREAGADAAALADDGKPYTTLGFANGPGAIAGGRADPASVDTAAVDYRQQATVPMRAETHGGEDVGVWARGPGAEAVRGSVEQNVLFHFMVQATPVLRDRLCMEGTCNADGVPVELPRPADFEGAAR